MKTIKEQFNNLNLLKLFEIEVIDKRTNEIDYIIFDIEIDEKQNTFVATYPPTTEEEEKSIYISHTILNIDDDVSIDVHLNQLHEDCTQIIINSEFYELT